MTFELTPSLTELAATENPWFALVPHPAVRQAARIAPGAAVIDPTDAHAVPVTVNPFEPGPQASVHAHIDRLAGLIEAAYRPPGPVRAVLRLALRKVYARGGWDLAAVRGAMAPRTVSPPWVPGIEDLTRAALLAADDLGCDVAMRTAVRAFCAGTLLPLWDGPAGRFLAGGHRPDLAAPRGVVFTPGEVTDSDAAFLAGALLYRIADAVAISRATPPHSPVPGVLLALPDVRLRRVISELNERGMPVMIAETQTGQPAADEPAPQAQVRQVPLVARRSAACGLQCRQRPCTTGELHVAARWAGHDGQVWLRLWSRALILAFLTGNPLPHVPHPLRRALLPLDVRTRECVLASLVEREVASRAPALRHSYDPLRLTSVAASAAAGLLALRPAQPGAPNPFRAGPVWVIPQIRWLHESERLTPLHGVRPALADIAPPLDFDLAGLVDWPGIKVADRLEGLRCHQLSMDRPRNQELALLALTGDRADAEAGGLAGDIEIAGIGRDYRQRLGYVGRLLGTRPRGDGPGWLEVVLSWPERLIQPPSADTCPRTAARQARHAATG